MRHEFQMRHAFYNLSHVAYDGYSLCDKAYQQWLSGHPENVYFDVTAQV